MTGRESEVMGVLVDGINRKSVLLLDVYDVLLQRLYRNPSDLFRGLEEGAPVQGFLESRENAQQVLAGNGDGQESWTVDLDTIYENMHQGYQPGKEKELELELLTTKLNPEAKRWMERAAQQNIPVYLCGKFRMPVAQVEKFLEENDCASYCKLYSLTGEMTQEAVYRDILRETGAAPASILHIKQGTGTAKAEKLGISVLPYESVFRRYGQNLNSSYFAVLNHHQKEDSIIPLLQGNIANYCATERGQEDWRSFGYKYIGILAFEYAKHMGNIVDSLGIKKVFFFSENGCTLKSAFDALFPSTDTAIISCSKRTLTLATIHGEQDLHAVLLGNLDKESTFRSWITMLCPSHEGEVYHTFQTLFPDQSRIIFSGDDFERLKQFIAVHKQFILEEAEKAQAELLRSLRHLEMFTTASAVVDISRNRSLLAGLASACRTEPMEQDLTAFFWEYVPTVRWSFSLIQQVEKSQRTEKDKGGANEYLGRILSLALYNPGGDESRVDALATLSYGNDDPKEACRTISQKILEGTLDCVHDLLHIDRVFPFALHQGAAMAVCEYLQEHIDRRDRTQLEMVRFTTNPYGWEEARPIFLQKNPVVGIVNPWPEDVSAEAEVITRMKRTAEENNLGCVLLGPFGHILTDNQKPTKKFYNEENLSFLITTHYECPKVLNTFYYNPLWNPPEIPLNLSDYTPRVTNYFMSNDDFLIYDKGGMSNYLRAILMNSPRTLEGGLPLTASFPISAAMPPKLDKPIMFYCGMNWEIMFGTAGRHDGLFKLLDDTGKVKYYGPERVEAWGGLKPWEGYRCYQGMIPFDGFSIVEKINECGICLVLSSDTHRRAGAATNRLYEACAAGAIMISDDNEFVLENFGDAALFIKFNKQDPIDTFNQIMEKYNWILKHPDEALQLARRAQEIYLKKYSLDAQMNQIVHNHPARMKQLAQDLYAQSQTGKVLVTFVLDTQKEKEAKKWLEIVIENVHDQIYSNVELAIAADETAAKEVQAFCNTKCAAANVVSMKLFDKKGIRAITDGEAIRTMQKQISHAYYVNTTAQEKWFFDHITSLVRAMTENDAMCAYSGASFEGADGCRRFNFFDALHVSHLYYMTAPDRPLAAGQFLFRADAHEYMPDYLFANLDGLEHLAYAGIVKYRHGAKLAFTTRMSLCFTNQEDDTRFNILTKEMQQRFIRDLIRFHIPEQMELHQVMASGPSADINKKGVSDMFLYLPLKNYIRLRYYRWRLRKLPTESKKYKKYAAKYDAIYDQYRQYWNA